MLDARMHRATPLAAALHRSRPRLRHRGRAAFPPPRPPLVAPNLRQGVGPQLRCPQSERTLGISPLTSVLAFDGNGPKHSADLFGGPHALHHALESRNPCGSDRTRRHQHRWVPHPRLPTSLLGHVHVCLIERPERATTRHRRPTSKRSLSLRPLLVAAGRGDEGGGPSFGRSLPHDPKQIELRAVAGVPIARCADRPRGRVVMRHIGSLHQFLRTNGTGMRAARDVDLGRGPAGGQRGPRACQHDDA